MVCRYFANTYRLMYRSVPEKILTLKKNPDCRNTATGYITFAARKEPGLKSRHSQTRVSGLVRYNII